MEHFGFLDSQGTYQHDMIESLCFLQGSGGLIFELADEWWKDGEGSLLAWVVLCGCGSLKG